MILQKNPENWYNFTQYLAQTINSSVLFEQSIDFPDFHGQLTTGDLIYANPQDSVRLIKEYSYIPVARPSNLFDEVIFVASNSKESPMISDISNKTITSVGSMMVTKVGLKYLQNNITPSNIDSKESWMAVVKSIFRQESDYAMIYKDFYNGLNNLSKSGLQAIGETSDGTIHHNFLVSKEFSDSVDIIQQCLTKMKSNTKSKAIISALSIESFIAVSKEEILRFEALQAYTLS